ncbi:MAG: methylenetetrahydrofolate reductase, partial [Gemmatimonadota bacterium]|nr:methylenetetrahydrofolate reductase [Gemmatimonadota bacterium]
VGAQQVGLDAHCLGLRNILAVTGDPPKLGDYPDATAVFDVDSIGLVSIISRLNRGLDMAGNPIGEPASFLTGVGANPGAIDLEREVRRLKAKIEAGAEYVLTQPVFEMDYLHRFLDLAGELPVPLLVGLLPLFSSRNAEFLHNEVPGMSVPEAVRSRMRRAGSGPAAQEEGVAVARQALEAVKPRVQGAYIMPPFGKWELALRVLDGFIETS